MGGLFGGKTATPAPTPVKRMPDEEDPAVKEARRRTAAESQTRSGRASTVLSRNNRSNQSSGGNAGTSAYTNSLLGQAG